MPLIYGLEKWNYERLVHEIKNMCSDLSPHEEISTQLNALFLIEEYLKELRKRIVEKIE